MERDRGDGTVVMSVCTPDLGITKKGYTTSQPSQPLTKEIKLNGKYVLVGENDAVKAEDSEKGTKLSVSCINGQPVEFIIKKS